MIKIEHTFPEILFLFPGFKEEDFLTFILTYHLGAGYILAYLKEKGIYATQFIHKELVTLDALTNKILAQRPRIVGFTCYDTNYYFVKLISQLLKKGNPKLTVIAGGPTATFSDELIMQDNSAIDICVRGEGEHTVYELVKRLRISSDISNIEGITYRSIGKLIRTPDRSLIRGKKKSEELDILPSPYLNNIIPPNENLGVLTSRGCIFKCIYCNFSAMSRWTVRYHSVERVISELKTIYKRLLDKNWESENIFVEIFDDAFSLNIERAKQICYRIIEEKIFLPLWAETRADRVDKELLNLMYQAGFETINFGLESAVPRVLHTIKKVRDYSSRGDYLICEKRFIEKVRENVKIANEIGLNPTVSVILGLPGATMKDDKKTIRFVRRLKVKSYYHDYLQIYPGTELFTTHRRYGLGIKQPLTILPYQTEYTYDVYKIPGIESSHRKFVERNQTDKMMRTMTGEYANLQRDGFSDLLFRNYSVDTKTTEWLNRYIVISPWIGFVSNYFDIRFAYHNFKKMFSAGLPIIHFSSLVKFDEKNTNPSNLDFESGRYELTLHTEVLSNRRERLSKLGFVRFIPFANYSYSSSDLLDLKKKSRDKIIFTLSTLDDVERLIKLAPYSNKVVVTRDMIKCDCYFLDECRWSDKDCPALRFPRAIVKNDNSIIPCFNGKPIAKVGDERKDAIKNLRLMWNDMKRKRGCTECPVRNSCSKCLFPYPINSKEYCQMRRKNYLNMAGVNKFFKLLKIIRKIKSSDGALPLKSKVERIVGVFDGELVIVNVNKERYLYHRCFDTLYAGFK